VFTGTAKPIPGRAPSSSPATAVATPTTAPLASINGPPELPSLSAASVWITSSSSAPFGAVRGRASALTIPAVTVRSSPKGFPVATTGSPTESRSESPRMSGVSARDGVSSWSTARSVAGSAPTSRAFTRSRLEKLTVIVSAPSTTWRLVTT